MPMQLIQRTTLLYQDEKSDKVYEVDLIQIGTDGTSEALYVVNFRYGKRGKSLREGSETAIAVPETEARRVYARLVASKTRKGYEDVTGQDLSQLEPGRVSVTTAEMPKGEINPAKREQLILQRLQAAIVSGENSVVQKNKKTKKEKTPWSLDRIIWRAGELSISAAAPLLMQLLTPERMRRYCVVWAVGNCGDTTVIPQLEGIYRDTKEPEHVRRIALEAIFKLSSSHKTELQIELLESLPQELKNPILQRDREGLAIALQNLFDTGHALDFVALDRLYQIDNEITRPILLKVLRTVPFKPNYFQRIRHIFKAAEYRCDAEVFGILARRFEREEAMYTKTYHIRLQDGSHIYAYDYSNYNHQTNSYPENPKFAEMMRGDSSELAYSDRTKKYLQSRIWRTLKTLGDLERQEYVNLATSVLLQYNDADAEAPRNSTRYAWDRRTWQRYEVSKTDWDRFAGYLTFNQILYRNSPRYEWKLNRSAWSCKGNYKPGDAVPDVREEAFPQLWTQQPQALLKLLLESQCQPIQEFAVKAIRSCMEFCQGLSLEIIVQLLAQPYEITAQLAFELARDRYNPNEPNLDLVGAIANCAYAPARTQAYQWIQAQPEFFFTNPHLTASLITSSEFQTRSFTKTILGTLGLSIEHSQAIVARVIALIVTLESGQEEFAAEICETLGLCFQSVLKNLDLGVILDLLQHPLSELQQFAAQILLDRETDATNLPIGLIEALLDSPWELVRIIGVQLFGRLPDEQLLAQMALLQTFLTHELAEMREAIRPCIRRLTIKNVTFRQELVSILLTVLQHPEADTEVQAFLLQLLSSDIPDWMESVSQEHTMTLLQTQSSAAQEMGGHILQANHQTWANDFNVGEIVQLTHHQVQLVRNTAKAIAQIQLPRFRQNPSELMGLVNILDSDWEDGRAFGMQLFGEWLTSEELTPAILINICDSNRADVRKFGRDLVTRCFQSNDGQEYLLKFSEHPANDMQLFTTQYLEIYASNNSDRLHELEPYFTRVLGQVNRARIAKQRIFAFLEREATKTETAAKIIAEILTRQSATIAIGDRAKSIEILLQIHRCYPGLKLAIAVKPVPCK
jgi:predicted DNA-binding WGR domain protein